MKDWKKTLVPSSASILEVIKIINNSSLQIALVVDEQSHLLGTVTDGDIRRAILNNVSLDGNITIIMRNNPKVGHPNQLKHELLNYMKYEGINQLPIVDDRGFVIGLELIGNLIQESSADNWVVIMAGGLGTRLKPLTDDRPKPMVKVGGKPVLETIIEGFIDQGFKTFYISVNHMAAQIEKHFGDGKKWNVDINYLIESKKMGTAGALSLLPAKPEKPIIVMNGDLLTKVNYNSLLNFHKEHEASATMCVRDYSMQIPYGVVRISNNSILEIDEKPVQRFFVNAGIYVLGTSALDIIPGNEHFDMTTLFERLIEKNYKTSVFPVSEYWIDIGYINDYEKANNEYEDIFINGQ